MFWSSQTRFYTHGVVEIDERTERTSDAKGFSLDAFSSTDWLLLAGTAITWGSSFMWMEVGLDGFAPTFITFLRIAFGALTLACFRQARLKVDRKDMGRVALLGLLWMGAPLLIFPIAQQWIDSALAGMLNGAVPVFAGVAAAIIVRRWPPRQTLAGIVLGFVGVVAISWPAVEGSSSSATGVGLVVVATVFYGIAINIAAPLQQRYGALPVLFRAQLVALAFTIVPGAIGAVQSELHWPSLAAMIPVGCFGTGLAFVWITTLAGRVGAGRASVTIYFVPVLAILLGAIFRHEPIERLSLVGTALVIAGAFLASRTQTPSGGAGRL